MSEDKQFPPPNLRGKALKKWKRQQKTANFFKTGSSAGGSALSSIASTTIERSENQIISENIHAIEQLTASSVVITDIERSPNEMVSDSANVLEQLSVASLHKRCDKEQGMSSAEPFFGFTPPEQLSSGEPFFGFTPPEQLSSGEPFFGFTASQKELPTIRKRTSKDIDVHDIVGVASKRNSLNVDNYIADVVSQKVASNQSEGTEKRCYKVVCGDYCQYDKEHFTEHKLCSAICVYALLYVVHKPVSTWFANDLNDILEWGQTYFFDSFVPLRETMYIDTTTVLHPKQLIPQLKVANQCYDVRVSDAELFGYFTQTEFMEAIQTFQELAIDSAVLQLGDNSYGFIKCVIDHSMTYILFDPHGRTSDGSRFGTFSAILFYDTVLSFVDSLYEQFKDVEEFRLIPVTFTFAFSCNRASENTSPAAASDCDPFPDTLPDHLPDALPIDLPVPNVRGFPLIDGQLYFKIVVGNFSQFDRRFPKPHHQCTCMVATAIAFATEKAIYSWNAADLDSILISGQRYYNLCLAALQQQGEFDSTMLAPENLISDFEACSNSYHLSEHNANTLGGYLDKDNLLRVIGEFNANCFNFGIIIFAGYSYGVMKSSENNCDFYCLFDSHRRTRDGRKKYGKFSSVIFFNDVISFVDFLLRDYQTKPYFQLHPVLVTRNEARPIVPPLERPEKKKDSRPKSSDVQPSANERIAQKNVSSDVPPAASERIAEKNVDDFVSQNQELFYDIQCGETSEYAQDFSYHPCRGIALASLLHGQVCPIEEWTNCDFEDVFVLGKEIFDDSHQHAVKHGFTELPSKVDELFTHILWDGKHKFHVHVEPPYIAYTLEINDLHKLFDHFQFHGYRWAILTIDDESYAIHKCITDDGYALYDCHGRNKYGEKNGSFSQLLFFTYLGEMFTFIMQESRRESTFSFEILRITSDNPDVGLSNIYDKIISGHLCQNDFACMATNFVFLVYTKLIPSNAWLSEDIDKIVVGGSQLHRESYANAPAIRHFCQNQFLDVHEINQRVIIKRSTTFIVLCTPSREKQIYGRLDYIISIIDDFFSHFTTGILRSTTHSVALHKYNDKEYFLFVGTGRNVKGLLEKNKPANIFVFDNAVSLAKFVIRLGQIRDFVLTPVLTQLERPDRPLQNTNTISHVGSDCFDSDDDVPLRRYDFTTQSLEDNIPLAELQRMGKRISQSLRPRTQTQLTQKTSQLSVKSLPTFKKSFKGQPFAKQLSDEKRRNYLRGQKKRERRKERFEKLPELEQQVRQRWNAFQKKLNRMGIPNSFKNFDAYYVAQLNDGFDKEIVAAADKGVAEIQRVEDLLHERLRYRGLKQTYLDAFGNHEDIDENNPLYRLFQLGPMDNKCTFCGALYFKEELNSRRQFTKCCMRGEIHSELPLQQAQNYPHILKELLTRRSPLSNSFMDNILLYNNVLSFASFGSTDFKHTYPSARFGPVVSVDGMIYHIAEHFQTNATGNGMPPAQVYFMDIGAAANERCNRAPEILNKSLLMRLENFLRANNGLASAYRMLGNVLREVKKRPNAPQTNVHLEIVRNRNEIALRQRHSGDFGVPTANEVAMVFTELPKAGTKNLVIFPIDASADDGVSIESHDPNRDAMCYPLLFPFAEQTWSYNLFRYHPNGQKKRDRITLREFYCYLFQHRDLFSPLLSAGKLSQLFIIDCFARVQQNYFEYLQTDQGKKKMRVETYGALQDYIESKNIFNDNLPGRIIPMPSSVVGSRRYIKEKYNDAMAVAARFGKPILFVTFTFNNMWKEFRDNIPPNAKPADYPLLIARVFNCKLKQLVDDLVNKEVLGKCSALLDVIEWQKRSSGVHAHMLLFAPESERPSNAADIDGIVSAEIPCPSNIRLYKAVTTYMYHNQCGVGTNASCMKMGPQGMKCSKGFPKPYVRESEVVPGGHVKYRRRNNGRTFQTASGSILDNRSIVPYNPYLTLKYDCHLNVEIVSQYDSIKYLFKYFHKGLLMARMKITLEDNVQVYNEFQHHVDSRYLSAGEASWRLLGNDAYYCTHTIYRLPVHLEHYQKVIFDEDNIQDAINHAGSQLTAYFQLNNDDPIARQYLYTEIPFHYVYDKSTRKWNPRSRNADNIIPRLYTVNYNAVELYSLRLLLLQIKGAVSFEALRNINGIQYDTFREAAISLGLLYDDSMLIQTFEEMVFVEMPSQLRHLFAQMLLFVGPADPLALWNRFKRNMFEDYTRKGYSPQMAENLALRHISVLLVAAGKCNTEFTLPEPQFASNVERREAERISREFDPNNFDIVEEQDEGQRLQGLLHPDQRVVFDAVINAVRNPQQTNDKLFFVDGPGGSGKTFLHSTFISTIRGMDLNVIVVGWTGMCVSLLKGGKTVHSTFKLPLNMHEGVTCNISDNSELGEKFRTADVVIWDEISLTLKYAFDAADSLFRAVTDLPNVPFGGKIIVTSGDWRQCLPIIKYGGRAQIVAATVKRSDVWQHFKTYKLITNKRLTNPNDIAFAQWQLDIGDGKLQDYPPNQYYNSFVQVPPECLEVDSIVDKLYGATFNLSDIERLAKYAIVTPLNEDADAFNEDIYNRAHEDVSTEKIYYSSDRITGLQPEDDDYYDVTFLNTLKPTGMPPHKLKLRENCIIMLLRNLNPTDGFCNGTRLIVKKLYNNCIRGEIFDGAHKGKQILIPRTRQTSATIDTSFEMERVQFPVQLCFVMTINKSQSQSFDEVGIFFRKPPFSHGQLYVAVSRVRSKEKLKIQVYPDVHMGQLIRNSDAIFIPNIVYKEIL